jgi:hypothetical protein
MTIKNLFTSIFLQSAGLEPTSSAIEEYQKQWWWNLRSDAKLSLRLTEAGIDFVKNEAKIKHYTIPFPKDLKITPQLLIWLDQSIRSPFYVNAKEIVVLRERVAVELYMFSGDIRKYGRNQALSIRLNQND